MPKTRIEDITIARDLGRSASLGDALLAKGHTERSTVLRHGVIEANKIASQMLRVPLATRLFDYEKLRVIDDVPMSLEHVLVPLELVPGIEQADLSDRSLYAHLYERYGLLEVHDEEEVLLVRASEEEAEQLGIAPDSEVMMIEGVSAVAAGEPFAYFQIISRPGFYQFRSDVYYE